MADRKFHRTQWLEEVTGIPRRTWEKKRLTGDTPPFYRIGGVVLYDEHEALEWIASRRATSTTEEQQRKAS